MRAPECGELVGHQRSGNPTSQLVQEDTIRYNNTDKCCILCAVSLSADITSLIYFFLFSPVFPSLSRGRHKSEHSWELKSPAPEHQPRRPIYTRTQGTTKENGTG